MCTLRYDINAKAVFIHGSCHPSHIVFHGVRCQVYVQDPNHSNLKLCTTENTKPSSIITGTSNIQRVYQKKKKKNGSLEISRELMEKDKIIQAEILKKKRKNIKIHAQRYFKCSHFLSSSGADWLTKPRELGSC